MAKIKVYLLNFHHFLFSHIELVLENLSVDPHAFYPINRWQPPMTQFQAYNYICIDRLRKASSTFTFEIEAEPGTIVKEWRDYYLKTMSSQSITGNNCAVAVQWFLSKFADIPNSSKDMTTINYLGFGIFVPSHLPLNICLPGRVFDNAKHHISKSMVKNNDSKPNIIGLYK